MKRIYKITIRVLLGGIAVMLFMCVLFILALLYLPYSCMPIEPHYVTQEEKLEREIERIEKDSLRQANSSRQTKEEVIVSWP